MPLDTLRLSGVCQPTRSVGVREVWMKIVQATLSLTLAIAGLVGIQILIDDKWLWAAAPSHAYGLIGFVSIDMILVVAALMRVGLATVSAALMATAQFAAMLADVVVGQPEGVPPIAFRNYLLGDAAYLGLLFIQIAILSVAIAGLTITLLHSHSRLAAFLHVHLN